MGGRRKFGKYVLLEKLRSEGEYVQCFRAVQHGLDREVEIRILTIRGGADSPLAVRFVEELKVLARLDHPSIIPVLDQGVAEGKCFFTTVLRSSQRMTDYLKARGGRLSTEEFLAHGETLTDALALIHGEGKLHRGLSSSSVYVDLDEGKPYIGECSAMREIREESLTELGVPSLSAHLPSPEVLRGEPGDERTDVYLACRLFYEMLTGRPPIQASYDELFRSVREHGTLGIDIPPPSAVVASVGEMEGLDELIVQGLEEQPSRRHVNALALRDELQKVATRHEVKLFVREEAHDRLAVRCREVGAKERVISPSSPEVHSLVAGVEDKHLFVAAGLASFILVLVVIRAFSGGGEPYASPPTEVATQAARQPRSIEGAEKEERLLASLADRVIREPTTGETFGERAESFRQWVMSPSGAAHRVCGYTELMQLRYNVLSTGDTEALAQFDRWVITAAELTGWSAP